MSPSQAFKVQDVSGGGDCLFLSVAVAEAWADRGVNLGFDGGANRAHQLRIAANDFLCPNGKPSTETIHNLPIEVCTRLAAFSALFC